MRHSGLSVEARRARLRLLLRERRGAALRDAIVARHAECGIDLPSSEWVDLEHTDELSKLFSAALQSHRTSGSAWTESFDDPRDLNVYLRGLIHQSDVEGAWVLFCDPDVAALTCRMSLALEDAACLVEADQELVCIFDRDVTRGLMIDRIVHIDNSVEYEVTLWGKAWPKRTES